ncbi:MAG: translesion error-prone DNA polymerase V autoproteolytic subunit [Candidatus Omnitrophota bacterium]
MKELNILKRENNLKFPLFSEGVSAGFPSPAEDYVERSLDLNELLIDHPAATFFVRASGHSMINAGIFSGDILVVDRALEPAANSIVIACLNGEFTVKRLFKKGKTVLLMPENEDFQAIDITDDEDCQIWGVVSYVIHSLKGSVL